MGTTHLVVKRLVVVLAALVVGMGGIARGGEEQGEMLKITVGETVQVGEASVTNSTGAAMSRSGEIAAFYPTTRWPGYEGQWHVYRVSEDGGKTWGELVDHLRPEIGDGSTWEEAGPGTVITNASATYLVPGKTDWFETEFRIFKDDFSDYIKELSRLYIPGAVLQYQEGRPPEHTWAGPVFSAMIELASGERLAALMGRFDGEAWGSVIIMRSTDHGKTWYYHGTAAHSEGDPNPELPGEFGGFSETSLAELPDGEILCVFRSQASHLDPDFKPIYQCRSTDGGRTWSKPVVTEPELINISPKMEVLDNGVVACLYGRPGFHIAFSLDNGKTWPQRVSVSHAALASVQNQMTKIGPNKLLAIGGLPGQGTVVIPVTVERVKDPNPGPFEVTGVVVDGEGKAVVGARVQWGPQQFTRAGNAPVEYKAIDEGKGWPVAVTDEQGVFRFGERRRGGAVLTVEAAGYAPLVHHVEAGPEMGEVKLTLERGSVVQGQVVDAEGRGVEGACVIVNEGAHVHTDKSGWYAWPMKGEVPERVDVRLVKKGYTHVARAMASAAMDRLVMRKLEAVAGGPVLPMVRVGLEGGPELEVGYAEGFWADVPVAREFVVETVGGAAKVPVEVKLAYNEKYIYAIAHVKPAAGVELTDEDMVEFLFENTAGWVYQFAFNVKGRVPGLFAWNTPGTVGHSTRLADGSWTAMVRTMWLQLNMKEPADIDFGLVHVPAVKGDVGSVREGLPMVYRFGGLKAEARDGSAVSGH
jgi:protocatechuate 3,4-dioxygenase beta subunit